MPDVTYNGPPLARSFAISLWFEAAVYGAFSNGARRRRRVLIFSQVSSGLSVGLRTLAMFDM